MEARLVTEVKKSAIEEDDKRKTRIYACFEGISHTQYVRVEMTPLGSLVIGIADT